MKKVKGIFLMAVLLLAGILNADSISGTIQDTEGTNVQAGFIEAIMMDANNVPVDTTRYFGTIIDGTYNIEIEEAGNFIVYAAGESSFGGIYTPEFYDNVQTIEEATLISLSGAGQVVENINFELELIQTGGTGSISGIVTDGNGTPVANAEIVLFDENSNMNTYYDVTAYDGTYNITAVGEGDLVLNVVASGFASYYFENATTIEDATLINFVEGTVHENYDLTLSSLNTYSISGTVLDIETGEPVSGQYVVAEPDMFGWGTESFMTMTNDSGEYTVEVTEGSYLLFTIERAIPGDELYLTQFFDHQGSPVDATILEVAGTVTDIDFDLTPTPTYDNSISGSVIFEGTIPNFEVYMVAISSEEEWEETALLSEDGTYEISNLPEGDYYVLALSMEAAPMYYENALDFEDATQIAVAGTVNNIDFVLEEASGGGHMNMNGNVVNEEGNPVANTSVFAVNHLGEVWSYARTDEDGNYSINNLVSGNYSTFATKVFYESDNNFVNVSGTTTNDFEIGSVALSIDDNNNSEISNFDLGNYPNPFNPETSINFSIKNNAKVNLTVFNSKGEMVKEVINTNLTSGSHRLHFDGSSFNSGVYYYTLSVDDKKVTKKMVLIK